MRRYLSVLMLGILSSAFAIAAPTLTPVKATHHRDSRVQRHRAHKAPKHKTPRRGHRTV